MEQPYLQKLQRPNPLNVDQILWVDHDDSRVHQIFNPGCITTVQITSAEMIRSLRADG